MGLNNLEISERLSNVCKISRIKTLEELFSLNFDDLNKIRGLGRKTLEEINALRMRFGLEPFTLPYKARSSKNTLHRKNIIYFLDQLISIDFNRLIRIDISKINLSNRLINVLLRHDIYTVEDLIKANIKPESFSELINVGVKTAREYESFYGMLKQRILRKSQSPPTRKKESGSLLNKELSDIIVSFPIYDALRKSGINKLKDIVDWEISPKKLHDHFGLKANQIREYGILFDKLQKESNQRSYSLFELVDKQENHFDISIIPQRFYNMPVSFFLLPPVVDKFLGNNQIVTFTELASKEKSQLKGITSFVKDTLTKLLYDISDSNLKKEFVPRLPHYFPCWVDNFIAGLADRDTEILKLRYGYYGKIFTLAEIGRKVSITRERSRQIIKNSINRFRKRFSALIKNAEIEYKRLIIENFEPIDEKQIFEKISKDDIIYPAFPGRMYLIFIRDLLPDLPVKVDGILLNRKLAAFEKKIESKIIKLLKERLPIYISKEKFGQFVKEKSEIDTFSFMRVSLISTQIQIDRNESKIKLGLKRITFDNAVRAIFNIIEYPITRSEFKKKLQLYFPNSNYFSVDDYIRSRLINHPVVYRLDTDLFGSIKHLNAICPNKNKIIEFCYQEMDNRKIPTAIYDLVPLISFSEMKLNPQNPNFILDAMISTDKRFIKLDRLLYGLKKWGKIELITVADLAYETIKRNKVPMHFKEIFNLVRQKRSVHEITINTILRIDRRFLNYPPGWYGLVETHYDNLVYLLLHNPYIDNLIFSQKPRTSLEEIMDSLDMEDYFDLTELEQILMNDQRFIIYDGEGQKKIFHKNWPIRKLITNILKNSKDGLDFQELQWRLNDLYGFARNFSSKDIKIALSSITNIIKVSNKHILSNDVKISDNLKEGIMLFVEKNMKHKNILYDLEETFDSFMDVFETEEEEITFHHFRICFENYCKKNFVQLGTYIYRRLD